MMDLHIQIDNDHGLEEAGFSAFWKVMDGNRIICVCDEQEDAEMILGALTYFMLKEKNNAAV